MINNIAFPPFNKLELIIFILTESILILGYFILFRYSRKHGGVFDRRVGERRFQINRANLHIGDRRLLDIGFSKVKVGFFNSNEIYEVDTDRRVHERRVLVDRRHI